jgi:PAS domain S-box-containing protein
MVATLRGLSWQASLLVMGIGLAAMVGWAFNMTVLTSLVPGQVTQKPSTAIGLVVSGMSLLVWHWQSTFRARLARSQGHRLLTLLAGLVIAFSLITLAEYFFDIDLGLNRLYGFEPPPNAVDALAGGQPAPNTSINFLLMGTALLLLGYRRYRVAQSLSAVVFLIALLALTGHLYQVGAFYTMGAITGMALPTAIAFLLLSIGGLFAQADQGWMHQFSGEYDGSIMMRRMLPLIILIPPLLGLLTLSLYNQLALFPEGVFALRTVLSVVLFSILLWWNGRSLNRLDARRRALQQQLDQTLESQITARTTELVAANQALRQEASDRQQAQTDFKDSEARFRRAIVDAPFPIIIHSEDGRIIQMSRAFLEISGYGEDELSTIEDWTKRAYGHRKAPVEADINRLYNLDYRKDEGEYVITTKTGASRTWLFSSAPLGTLSDGTKLVISMAADVTAQKVAEAALANQLRQQAIVARLSQIALTDVSLQTLLDQATQLVAQALAVDYCKILEWRPEQRSLWLRSGVGWPHGLVGHTLIRADDNSQASYTLHSQHPVVVKDLATETRFQGPSLLTDNGVVSGVSITIQSRGDRQFGVLGVHTTQRRSFSQDEINFLQTIANVLAAAIERKHTEETLQQFNLTLEQRVHDRTQALEEVNQELEAFSYSVAHDLRAPLRAIQGFAHVLQEDYGTVLDTFGQDCVQRMAASAEHLDVLIHDLLTYSQLGRTDITLQRVDLNHVLDQVLNDLQPQLYLLNANVVVEPGMPSVYAQRSILRQVLKNLVDNALKFVAPGVTPCVRIWAEPSHSLSDAGGGAAQRSVKLWIKDNGIGIAPRHQQRIFDPFERLHGVEAYSGTGIGLSIVSRGVQKMGGQVGLESAADQGSCFWIELKG